MAQAHDMECRWSRAQVHQSFLQWSNMSWFHATSSRIFRCHARNASQMPQPSRRSTPVAAVLGALLCCGGVLAQRTYDREKLGVLLQLAIFLPLQTIVHPHNVGKPHVSLHPLGRRGPIRMEPAAMDALVLVMWKNGVFDTGLQNERLVSFVEMTTCERNRQAETSSSMLVSPFRCFNVWK